MRTKKFQFPLFSFYDVSGMERHLERMAAKGWMLHHLSPYGWHYVRCEKQKVHFTVTYYPKASAFEPEPSEGQKTFEDFCDHGGWQLAASSAKLMIFVSRDEAPVPIHTDPETELELLEQASTQSVALSAGLLAFLLLLFLVNPLGGLHMLRFQPIRYLASPTSLVSGLSMALLFLYEVLELSTWFRWRRRARAAAEQGAPLPPTHGYHHLIGFVALFFPLGTVCTLLTSNHPSLGLSVLLTMGAFAALNLIVNAVRSALKRRQVPTHRNRMITLAVDIVLALILFGLLTWIMFALAGRDRQTSPSDGAALTAEMLTNIPQPSAVQHITRNVSPLVTQTLCWDLPSGQIPQKEVRTLSYEVLDIHLKPLYAPCFRELFHRYDYSNDDGRVWEADTPPYAYQPMDPAPWGAREAWQLSAYGEPRSTYLVCWDRVILSLETSWMMDETQMALVAEQLG